MVQQAEAIEARIPTRANYTRIYLDLNLHRYLSLVEETLEAGGPEFLAVASTHAQLEDTKSKLREIHANCERIVKAGIIADKTSRQKYDGIRDVCCMMLEDTDLPWKQQS